MKPIHPSPGVFGRTAFIPPSQSGPGIALWARKKGFLGNLVECGHVLSSATGTPLISGWQAGDRWYHCLHGPSRSSVGRLVTGRESKPRRLLYGHRPLILSSESSHPSCLDAPKRAEHAQDLGHNRPLTHRREYKGCVFQILLPRFFPSLKLLTSQ